MATWFGIVVAVILLIIVLTLISGLTPRRVPPRHESREARSEALQLFADEVGVSFDPEPDNSILEDLLQTQTFLDIRRRGGEPSRTLYFVRTLLEIHDEDLVLRAMDYQDITLFLNEPGDWEQEHTIAVVQTEGFDLPRLHAVLLPKGRVAGVLGRWALRHWARQESHWKDWQIVDVAGNERVARRYVFRAPDEDAARRVLSNDLLAILADSSVSFEAFGNRLILWQSETHVEKGVLYYSSSYRERLIPPEDIPSFLSECRKICRRLSQSY